MSCSTCGCAPCACNNPSILNQPQIIQPTVSGGTFTTPQINSPTITNGQASGTQFTGVTIDATSTGFTQPPGTCDASLATTNYVCTALVAGINGTNPAFCNAVSVCLAGSPTLCSDIISCINSTPGALFNPIVFDPSVYASTLIVGVTRFATLAEVQGASCSLAVDPCTLGAFWSAGGPNALWATFESAVNSIIAASPSICAAIDACLPTSATLCAAVTACGFAPLGNPVFTGDPQAPTPAPGDNDTSISTTAFVQGEITTAVAAIAAGFCASIDACVAVPSVAFCAAVTTCVGAGFAPLNSPVFTGDPQAPTAAAGDNDTSIATTAFVQSAIAASEASIFSSATPVGNVAATETDAFLHSISAALLAANFDAIQFEAAGSFAATASVNKRIRVYFGATIVFDSGLLAIITAQTWHLTGTVLRTGAAAEKIATTLTTSDGTIQAIANYSTAAENLAVIQPMKLTLNGTNANDVIAEFYRDRFVAA